VRQPSGLTSLTPGQQPDSGSPRPAGGRGLLPRAKSRIRLVAYTTLLVAGLCGLAVAAIGAAHQLMPRQFTAKQARQIVTWEMTRRWRALPAGKIFPATVSYPLSGQAFLAAKGLELSAQRLGIEKSTSCAKALTAVAARILQRNGCAAVLRATYIDSSGSLLATIGVVVLPDSTAARAAVKQLSAAPLVTSEALRVLPVKGTLADRFLDSQRQLSKVEAAGPYVIFATAGFSDGRPARVKIRSDYYLDHELAALAGGLETSANYAVGISPRPPACPGAPGC
jgi:hypothetical protein